MFLKRLLRRYTSNISFVVYDSVYVYIYIYCLYKNEHKKVDLFV